jgi:16S rRNA G966 N2-methylase RsmD/predicted transcriptional regulator
VAHKSKPLTQADKRKQIADILRVSPQLSSRKIAELVGVSPTTVSKIRKEFTDKTVQSGQMDTQAEEWNTYIRENPDILVGLSERSLRALKNPEVRAKMVQIKSRSPRYCQRLLYKERLEANKHPAITVTEDDVEVFVGDVKTGLPQIKDDSVDLIFVDPMYDLESVQELYKHIASLAGRVLVEGGSLAVMIGGSYLKEALHELSSDSRLTFNWDIAYVCPRGLPLIPNRKVSTAVKHVLWFVKGRYEGKIVYDYIEAPADDSDKTLHRYGQSVEGVKEILRRLSKDGDTILDPCCGGGSTVAAALGLGGRRVIACDIDEEAVKTTKKRVRKLFGHER